MTSRADRSQGLFTTPERDLIRRELGMRFGQLASVDNGVFLRTWRAGPRTGQPKLPVAMRGMLERGVVEVRSDAQFRSKHATQWTGYMVHITETCDEEMPRPVVHADTTAANMHEAERTAAIHDALAAKSLAPSEHLVDSAYVSAGHLVAARTQHGIDLVGPGRPT